MWLEWLAYPLPIGRCWLGLGSNPGDSASALPGIKWTRGNLLLTDHAAYEYGGLDKERNLRFERSHKPDMAGLDSEDDSTMKAPYL